MNQVVLVDKNNNEIGLADKMQAHLKGFLHRAFSTIVINDSREILLQKRSFSKYHTPGLWTNACCSHPKPNESYTDAIIRRLDEEMGMKCKLNAAFSFVYRSKLSSELIEYEHDTVYIGETNILPKINKHEVAEYKYLSFNRLHSEVQNYPHLYTPWFKIILNKMDSNFFMNKSIFYYA